jgi:hypothetical protein
MVVKKKVVKTETIIKEDKPNISISKKTTTTTRRKRRRKNPIKKIVKTTIQRSDMQVDKLLVENFVSLQKVMTNLAAKFENLSDQISKLLELFEISAKTLSEKGYSTGEDKKILSKLDSLLEHDKVIAKGIALLHERSMPEEQEVVIMPSQPMQQTPMQMPQRQIPQTQRMMPQQMKTPLGAERLIPTSSQTEPPKTRFVKEA